MYEIVVNIMVLGKYIRFFFTMLNLRSDRLDSLEFRTGSSERIMFATGRQMEYGYIGWNVILYGFVIN